LIEVAIYLQNLLKKGKGKAIPLQAWTGPEGSRRLRLPDCRWEMGFNWAFKRLTGDKHTVVLRLL
jgi:hypothetical protein